MQFIDKLLKDRDKLGWFSAAIIYFIFLRNFAMIYLPLFLLAAAVQTTYTPFETIATEITPKLVSKCGNVNSVVNDQFQMGSEQLFSSISNVRLFSASLVSYFGVSPLLYFDKAKTKKDLEDRILEIHKNLTINAPLDVKTIRKYFTDRYWTKADPSVNWLNHYTLSLLSSQEKMQKFLTTYEVNFLKELDENPVATSAELEDAKNFYGDFLPKHCKFEQYTQAAETLKDAMDKILGDHQKATYKFTLPMTTLNLIVVLLFTVLVFLNKKEIEIRSRHPTFLIHLFLSVVFSSLTAFLFVATGVPFKPLIMSPILATLVFVFFLSGLSAINCRQRLMHVLFNRPERSYSYFFPWCYHSIIIVAAGFLCMASLYVKWLNHIFTSFAITYGVILIAGIFFLVENFCYLILTRKCWFMFVDYYYNIRIFLLFGVLLIPTTIHVIAHPLTSASLFYISFVTSCYLVDSYTLPLIKIYLRRAGNPLFKDVDFIAQNKIFYVEQIIADQELRSLFVDY
ncbi:uncharacterized protein LOC135120868, partial [Zophobas morio]|uniref:uncharacterized protein LOC135120868 n=1 Tax=Zophobas morio TaxID=2755281 RepID=UPI0030829AB0